MRIPFSKVSWGKEEEEALIRVARSGWLAAGPETEAFEREFAEYVGCTYAIFTNSCTSALKMGYKFYKERGFERVNYPKNTFCATYSAAIEVGLDVQAFVEEDEEMVFEEQKDWEWKNDFDVGMHYGGIRCSDYPDMLIEDSAHRIEPNDPLVGKIRCYSFYATKNMTTGSGGMLVTNDKEIYDRCRLYWRDGLTTSTRDRNQGPVDYEVKAFAGGYDGNDLAAAVGRVQLRRLPELTARRNAIRDRYNDAFGLGWGGNHLFCVDLGSEERVRQCRQYLYERGIGSGYHYPSTGWTSVSLPIYPDLTEDQQSEVITAMKEGGYAP